MCPTLSPLLPIAMEDEGGGAAASGAAQCQCSMQYAE